MLFCNLTFSKAQAKKQPIKKTVSKVTTTKPVTSKFGALAIDRSNGFYYGFSYDYPTLPEAEKKATDECNKKGGDCSVVLSFPAQAASLTEQLTEMQEMLMDGESQAQKKQLMLLQWEKL